MPSSKTNSTLASSTGGTRRNLRKRSSPSSQNILKPIVPSTFSDRNRGDNNSSFDAVLAAAATAISTSTSTTTTNTSSSTPTAPSNLSLASFYPTQHEQTLQGQTINSIIQGTTITNETPKRLKIASNSNVSTTTSSTKTASTNAKPLKSSISKTSSPLQMMLEVEENRKMLKSLPDIQPNHLHQQHHNYYNNNNNNNNNQQHNPHSSPLLHLQQRNHQHQQLHYSQQSLIPQSSSSAYTTHSQIESCESPFDVFAFKENVIPPNSRRHSAVSQKIGCAGTASTTKNYDKGLRHFSARVCAKVEEKGSTTYNEVADELVKEIALEKMATPSQGSGGGGIVLSTGSATSSGSIKCTTSSDHKNIRRRVYDALNVLMAIDVIVKDKKEIRWLGIPDLSDRYFNDDNVSFGGGGAVDGGLTYNNGVSSCSSDPLERILLTNKTISDRLMEKKRNLLELTQRTIALQNLIKRNSKAVNTDHMLRLSESSSGSNVSAESIRTPLSSPLNDRLALPFILINAPKNCRVHCEMLEDQSQYFFEFDSPFLINEDIELLRLMDNGHLLKGRFDKEQQDGLEEDTYGGLFKISNNNNSMICKDHLRLPALPSSIISFYQKMNNTNLKGKNLTLNLIRSLSPASIAACDGGTSSSSSSLTAAAAAFFDSKQHNPLS